MAWIPKDAKWYLAEIVQELKVEGDDTSLVWINFMLIRADSPEEAYKRSLEVGKEYEFSDQNTDGETVHSVFRGLHNLHVIYDELEHGSEILYEEKSDFNEAQIQGLVRAKTELSVFRSD